MSGAVSANGGAADQEVMLGPIRGGLHDVGIRTGDPERPFSPVPSHDSDSEVALQTMVLQIPEDPIEINGSPYRIEVDEPRLAGAINHGIRHWGNRIGYNEPRSLTIDLTDETLPPKLAGPSEDSPKPVHDFHHNGLRIEVPKEVIKSQYSSDELAETVQRTLNDDLELGILENQVLKDYLGIRKFLLKASAVGMAAVGEAVGVATSNGSVGEIATRGTGGAVLGALAVGVATLGRQIYDIQRFNTNVHPAFRRLSYWRARLMKKEIDESHGKSYHRTPQLRGKPIISLVPATKE